MEAPTPIDGLQAPVPPPAPARTLNKGVVTAAVVVGLLMILGAISYLTDGWPFGHREPLSQPTVTPSAPVDITAGWKTYTDRSVGFQFRYPQTFGDPEGTADARTTSFAHEGLPPETNARDAVFTVTTTTESAEACALGLRPGSVPETVDVSGQSWYHDSYADAGAGNFYETDEYHTFRDGICYKVVLTVHTVNPDAFPEEQRPEVFDASPLREQLRLMVFTFRFFGSTEGWRTHANAQYGFTFQYPLDFEIVTDKDAWPHAILLLYNGGQSYDIAVEIWDNENGFQETYHEVPDINRQIDDHWLTVWNITDEPGNEQLLATFKFTR